MKGFRGRKPNKSTNQDSNSQSDFSHLEDIFMRNPFPETSATTESTDEQEAAELTIGFTSLSLPILYNFVTYI